MQLRKGKNSARNSARILKLSNSKILALFVDPMPINYTIPTIVRATAGWYIEFNFLNPYDLETWDRIRITTQMNRKKFLPFREQIAQDLLKLVTAKLKAGKLPSRYTHLAESTSPSTANPDTIPATTIHHTIIHPSLPPTSPLVLLDELRKVAARFALGKGLATERGYKTQINHLETFFKKGRKGKFTAG